MRHTRRRAAVVLIAAAALLATAGIATAAIPDAGTPVYHACLLKNVGTIRLIDPSLPAGNLLSHCVNAETTITWNQTGPAGPAGKTGATGPMGPAGQDGTSVQVNPQPVQCPNGGVTLVAGTDTTDICNGANGADGAAGARGPAGPEGPQGPQGPAGSPPTAYYAHPAPTNVGGGGFTHVVTLTVDPGTYLVTTSVTLTTGPSSVSGWQAICGIGTGNGTYVAKAEGNASPISMSLAPVAVISTTGTLVLDCAADVAVVTKNGDTNLTAVAVNAL